MKPTFYLHMGVHKTATTALQHFGDLNYDALLKQNILYPKSLRFLDHSPPLLGQVDFAHHKFAWKCGFGSQKLQEMVRGVVHQDEKALCALLLEEMAATSTNKVWVSSEVFSESVNRDLLLELKNTFSAFEFKVVVYLRRQDDRLESSYNTFIEMQNSNEKVFDYCKNQRLHYLNFLKCLVDVFGQENLLLNIFEKASFKENIFVDFLDCLGANFSEDMIIPPREKSNVSYPPELQEILRIVNPYVGIHEKNFLRAQMIAMLADDKMKSAFSNDPILSSQERAEILYDYLEENKQIAQQFFGRDSIFSETDTTETGAAPYRGIELEKILPILFKFIFSYRAPVNRLQSELEEMKTQYLEQNKKLITLEQEIAILKRQLDK